MIIPDNNQPFLLTVHIYLSKSGAIMAINDLKLRSQSAHVQPRKDKEVRR